MPRVHLTDLTVRNLPPTASYVTYWDSKLSSFGVRVGLKSKTFVVVQGEARRRITVGSYPDMALADARKEAMRLLTIEPTETPDTTTLAQLIDLFFAVRCTPQNNKPSTIKEYRYIFKRHLTPVLKLKLTDITHARITRIIDALAPTPMEANHAVVAFRMLFRFAQQRRLLMLDPLDAMTLPYQAKSRDRVLTDDELRIVWQTAQAFPFPFGNIVLLLILTGQRLGEVSGLQWDWIDDREFTVTLPPEITKNSTKHTIPLGSLAFGIIERTPCTSQFLFPSIKGDAAYVGHNKAKGQLEEKGNAAWAKLRNVPDTTIKPWTLHDLRRTYATIHARIGTPPHVTEALLNHKTGTRSPIQRIYDRHTYLPEMRTAIAKYEAYLNDLLTKNPQVATQSPECATTD